jgi:hypothetical protein
VYAISQELMAWLCLARDLLADDIDLLDGITAGKVSHVSEDG